MWFWVILVNGLLLLYVLPIFIFFWLYYDDNRILTIEKAEKIKRFISGLLINNVLLYIPFFYSYAFLTTLYDKLPNIWPTFIPAIFSVINVSLSNGLVRKARNRVEKETVRLEL